MIRDETFNILLASRDTVRPEPPSYIRVKLNLDQTAGLTTFTITMLAEHPEVYARLCREVLDTLGSNGKVGPDNLRDMKYLRAVLNGEQNLSTFTHCRLIEKCD